MTFSLQDVFLATGSVMFVLISGVMLFLLLALVRLFIKIQTLIESATETLEDIKQTRHSLQFGIFRLLLKMIGGDK